MSDQRPGSDDPGGSPDAPAGKPRTFGILTGVLVALGAALFCGTGVGALWFFDDLRGWLFTPHSVAYEHLPGSCQIVAHLDVKGALRSPVFQRQVAPALEAAVQGETDEDKLTATLVAARLDPRKDIESAALCVQRIEGRDADFVLILGGRIRPQVVLRALELHGSTGRFQRRVAGDLNVLDVVGTTTKISQADDGALIFGNSEDLVRAASASSPDWNRWALPVSEQIALVATRAGLQAASEMAGSTHPLASTLAKANRGEARFSLNTGQLSALLDLGTEKSANDAARGLNLVLLGAKIQLLRDPETRDIIRSVAIGTQGSQLTGTVTVPPAVLDDAARELAETIQRVRHLL